MTHLGFLEAYEVPISFLILPTMRPQLVERARTKNISESQVRLGETSNVLKKLVFFVYEICGP